MTGFMDLLKPELKSFIRGSGFFVPLSDPGANKQLLLTDDNRWQKYHPLFNKGIDLGQKGKIDEAIETLVLYAKENPAGYQAWSTLANYYADIKDFPNSFFCFEKAKEIIPEDPYILRNYAFALRASGREGFSIIIKDFTYTIAQL